MRIRWRTFLIAVSLMAVLSAGVSTAGADDDRHGSHHDYNDHYSFGWGLSLGYPPPYWGGYGPGYGYYGPGYPYGPYGGGYGSSIGLGFSGGGYHDAYSLFFSLPLYFGPRYAPAPAPILVFKIEAKEGNLYGSLVDILRNGSCVMLLGIGLTLVIATGGVDLSVGAVMAIAASTAGILMNPSALWNEVFFVTDPNYTFQPLWLVILVALFVSILCGLWNGMLVGYMRIQPMVATLILMISGRGIAQLITNGLRVQITYTPYMILGQGWFILPFSLYLVAIVFTVDWLLTRHIH